MLVFKYCSKNLCPQILQHTALWAKGISLSCPGIKSTGAGRPQSRRRERGRSEENINVLALCFELSTTQILREPGAFFSEQIFTGCKTFNIKVDSLVRYYRK